MVFINEEEQPQECSLQLCLVVHSEVGFIPHELIKACLNFLVLEAGDVELNVLKAICMLFHILTLTP